MDSNSNKMTSTEAFIAGYPEDVQKKLHEVRAAIQKAAPQAVEIISYGLPGFAQNGTLLLFGAGKNHIGLYPTPAAIEAFKEDLSAYKTSKGAIQLPLDQPLPLELIARITKFKLAENAKQAEAKKARKK
jgi:uncharacterized protein YdhG (YjbR/CyaY superfamily)